MTQQQNNSKEQDMLAMATVGAVGTIHKPDQVITQKSSEQAQLQGQPAQLQDSEDRA
ncbi:hypothetical protein [Brevibacillus dissolubilis]|uniref:hypothetical protein n=1 Tax=Brevibacillus dissolubilis TaxID=1844116 RepID=UPI00159B8A76|nr:hypothetical protein [Brevibacillus dissolubilis]